MICVNQNFYFSDWMMLDGCGSGWVCSTFSNNNFHISHINNLNELKVCKYTKIYIDMPVKLPKSITNYPRNSDIKGKKILGKFHASIFYAPPKVWLNQDLQDINKICKKHAKPKLSIQSFNLFKKIKETQQFNYKNPNILYEVHPEILVHSYVKDKKLSKKTNSGILQRLNIINSYLNDNLSIKQIFQTKHALKNIFSHSNFKVDDIIDSLFCTCLINYYELWKTNKKNDTIKKDDTFRRLTIFN